MRAFIFPSTVLLVARSTSRAVSCRFNELRPSTSRGPNGSRRPKHVSIQPTMKRIDAKPQSNQTGAVDGGITRLFAVERRCAEPALGNHSSAQRRRPDSRCPAGLYNQLARVTRSFPITFSTTWPVLGPI